MMRSIPHFPVFMLIWDTLVKLVPTPPRVSVSGARINGGSFRTFVTRALASDDPEGPTFAAHFNKLKPYAIDDISCGPVSSELPSFPSAELPHPPTDPPSIVSVPSSPPAPAVPTSPLFRVLCPRWFLVLWKSLPKFHLDDVPQHEHSRTVLQYLADDQMDKALDAGLTRHTPLQVLCDQLQRLFQPPLSVEEALDQLLNRSSKNDETPRQFADALPRLARDAFPSLSAADRDQVVLYHFKRGLGSQEVTYSLRIQPPGDLNEAIQRASRMLSTEAPAGDNHPRTESWKTTPDRRQQNHSSWARPQYQPSQQFNRGNRPSTFRTPYRPPPFTAEPRPFQGDRDSTAAAITKEVPTPTTPKRYYSTTRQELLPVLTFVKKFHHYLTDKRFILRTDHQAFRWLENFKDPTGQLARSQADLLVHSYTVVHRTDKKHQDADALSNRTQTPPPLDAYAPVTAISSIAHDYLRWASTQTTEPQISLIYAHVHHGTPKPPSEEMESSSWETRCLWWEWDSLRLCDKVLFFYRSTSFGLTSRCVPCHTRLHNDLRYSGQFRTDAAARQRFCCPNQRQVIRDICNTCLVCVDVKNPNPTHCAPPQPIQESYPNEIVGVDLMCPMPLSHFAAFLPSTVPPSNLEFPSENCPANKKPIDD
ncbi:hypothetical protein SprV_0501815800 [Sparganum proliferum]